MNKLPFKKSQLQLRFHSFRFFSFFFFTEWKLQKADASLALPGTQQLATSPQSTRHVIGCLPLVRVTLHFNHAPEHTVRPRVQFVVREQQSVEQSGSTVYNAHKLWLLTLEIYQNTPGRGKMVQLCGFKISRSVLFRTRDLILVLYEC